MLLRVVGPGSAIGRLRTIHITAVVGTRLMTAQTWAMLLVALRVRIGMAAAAIIAGINLRMVSPRTTIPALGLSVRAWLASKTLAWTLHAWTSESALGAGLRTYIGSLAAIIWLRTALLGIVRRSIAIGRLLAVCVGAVVGVRLMSARTWTILPITPRLGVGVVASAIITATNSRVISLRTAILALGLDAWPTPIRTTTDVLWSSALAFLASRTVIRTIKLGVIWWLITVQPLWVGRCVGRGAGLRAGPRAKPYDAGDGHGKDKLLFHNAVES